MIKKGAGCIVSLLALLLPLVVSAHATPVGYSPGPSVILATSTPPVVTIQFSEEVDPSASSLKVLGPQGTVVSTGAPYTDAKDAHVFSVPVQGAGLGLYQVEWSAVAADDGHFSKGSYAFRVGPGTIVAPGATAQMVQVTTTPEVVGMTIELLGNGILWATLLLFLFAVRPIIRSGRYAKETRTIHRGYAFFLLSGVLLAFIGGAMQIGVKADDLASLQGIPFLTALTHYLPTGAGSATLWRMACVAGVGVLFAFGRRAIRAAERITPSEMGMIALMCAFAYLRAKISHAATNPFYPELSITINFFHLIEKDIWAGMLAILAACALTPRLRTFLDELLPKAFVMIAIDLAAVSVTACYIVWLHLKTYANLFSTQWGAVFLQLLLVAVLLVGMRLYHVFARLHAPRLFARLLPLSLGAEFACGLLVIYASSVVIITSPPLAEAANRTMDTFTWVILGIAGAALLFSAGVYALSRTRVAVAPAPTRPFATGAAAAAFLVFASAGAYGMNLLVTSGFSNPFRAECQADGNMWDLMLPSRAGIPTSETPQEGCMWGSGNYLYHFTSRAEYEQARNLPHAVVTLDHPAVITAGTPAKLTFVLKEADGSPANLFVDMEKYVHIVIVSKDETSFAHIHPDDLAELTPEQIASSTFSRAYVFPKAGTYLVSVDYAHGLTLESKQFTVEVGGGPAQSSKAATYQDAGTFGGYQVTLDPGVPIAGQVATMFFRITKDGKPVTALSPYLDAAMHVSVVKNDLTAFVHVHGEIHPPGTPYPPIIVKNGQIVHSMAMMYLPSTFGSPVDAHLIFPTSGLYTVWGEFKVGDTVIPTSFTVKVE